MEATDEVSPAMNSDLDIEKCLYSILDLISEQGPSHDIHTLIPSPAQVSSSLLAEKSSQLGTLETSLREIFGQVPISPEDYTSNLKENYELQKSEIEPSYSDTDLLVDLSSKLTNDSRTQQMGSFESVHASYDLLMTESSPKMSPISTSPGASVLMASPGVSSHPEGKESTCDVVLNKTFKEYPSLDSYDFLEHSRNSLSKIMDYIKDPPSPIGRESNRPRLSNEEVLQCGISDFGHKASVLPYCEKMGLSDDKYLSKNPTTSSDDELLDDIVQRFSNLVTDEEKNDINVEEMPPTEIIADDKNLSKNPTASSDDELLDDMDQRISKLVTDEEKNDIYVEEMPPTEIIARKFQDYYYETPKFPKSDLEKPVASSLFYNDSASVKWNEELADIDSPDKENVPKQGSEGETAQASSFGTRKVQKDSNDTVEVAQTSVPLVMGQLKSRIGHLSSNPTFKKPWPATGAIPKGKPDPRVAAIKPTKPTVKSTIIKTVTGKTGQVTAGSVPVKVKYDLTKNIYAQKTVPKSKSEIDTAKPKPTSTSSTKNPAGGARTGMVKTRTTKPVEDIQIPKRGISATRRMATDTETARRGVSSTRKTAVDVEVLKRGISATRKLPADIETDKRGTSSARKPSKGPIASTATESSKVDSRSRNPSKNT